MLKKPEAKVFYDKLVKQKRIIEIAPENKQ